VDKIITSMFSTDFVSGDPLGSDDIAKVRWFKLADVKSLLVAGETAEEHSPQLSLLISKYNEN
jgi:bifunctional NMN adenylyltransferase/nudix hydrolase